ncbi:Rho termination factor N-terminal domain-containing protein [Cellulomonas sp. URHD0024]|uniref:Rho termination factor N-terminal domain-containing protein n=1 Tax=Cellulomonas sp. URHD0024 TaxID=1302620 RepID=UPI0004174AB4|nr:Rho termination factor N-terminal domain-containing protein [Cellulomonas sp. URHD0024]
MPGRIRDPRITGAAIGEALGAVGGSEGQVTPAADASDAASRSAAVPKSARPGEYEEWSVDELRHRAAELDIVGHSTMRKDELVAALRNR